jgi:hypothetical protein
VSSLTRQAVAVKRTEVRVGGIKQASETTGDLPIRASSIVHGGEIAEVRGADGQVREVVATGG